MTTVLGLADPEAELLRQYLLSHEDINNSKLLNLPAANYETTELKSVPVRPRDGALENQCWDNVLRAEADGEGRAVFGWALWRDICPDSVAAQHHAVLETPEGELVCITPHDDQLGVSEITFFADNRVPYDSQNKRAPALLLKNLHPHGDNTRVHVWVDADLEPVANFFGKGEFAMIKMKE